MSSDTRKYVRDILLEVISRVRGHVQSDEYLEYVFPVLFLKVVSTRYEQCRRGLEKEAFASDNSDVEIETIVSDPSAYAEKGALYVPPEARWRHLTQVAKKTEHRLPETLTNAFESLSSANPSLEVTPPDYRNSPLDPHALSLLIHGFSELEARRASNFVANKEAAGLLSEELITEFVEIGGLETAQYRTPRSVAQLLVHLSKAHSAEVIFDPACGSGSFLTHVARFSEDQDNHKFYGQDINKKALFLCQMNLFLNGQGHQTKLRLGDSLIADKFPDLRADTILTHPPFNMRDWGRDRLRPDDPRFEIGERHVEPSSRNANYFWLSHILHHLKDDGIGVCLMTNGTLNSGAPKAKEAREAFIEGGGVDCIIQLPDNLMHGTSIPVCVWVLRPRKEREEQDSILLIDARDKGEAELRHRRVLKDNDIEEISGVYQSFRDDILEKKGHPGFFKVVSLSDIRNHNYSLAPSRYVGLPELGHSDQAVEIEDLIDSKKQWGAWLSSVSTNSFIRDGETESGLKVRLQGILADQPLGLKGSGIKFATRGGSSVRSAHHFGLEEEEKNAVPFEFLKRILGKIIVSGWDDLKSYHDNHNQRTSEYNEVESWVQKQIREIAKEEEERLEDQFRNELNRKTDNIPESAQIIARQFGRIAFDKYRGDSKVKLDFILDTILTTFAKEPKLDDVSPLDFELSDYSLETLGFAELLLMGKKVGARLRQTYSFEEFLSRPRTKEIELLDLLLRDHLWMLRLAFDEKLISKENLEREVRLTSEKQVQVDFLFRSSDSSDVLVVEIKSPNYRANPSALQKVQKYCQVLDQLTDQESTIRGLLLTGEGEDIEDTDEVQVVTYPELLERVRVHLEDKLQTDRAR